MLWRRDDEVITLNEHGERVKVKSCAFETDDGTNDAAACKLYKLELAWCLAENQRQDKEIEKLKAEVEKLKGKSIRHRNAWIERETRYSVEKGRLCDETAALRRADHASLVPHTTV